MVQGYRWVVVKHWQHALINLFTKGSAVITSMCTVTTPALSKIHPYSSSTRSQSEFLWPGFLSLLSPHVVTFTSSSTLSSQITSFSGKRISNSSKNCPSQASQLSPGGSHSRAVRGSHFYLFCLKGKINGNKWRSHLCGWLVCSSCSNSEQSKPHF